MMLRFLLLIVSISTASSVLGDSYDVTIAMFEANGAVQPFFEDAHAYAVFPTVGKGGFGIGAAYGKGKVYRNGRVTGKVSIKKLTIGFQLGGQAFSEIIFLQDERAYDEFTSGSYEFDATASAVAISAGVSAQAGTTGTSANASVSPMTAAHADMGYRKGMAVFTHTIGGLMYEAAIGGQKFKFKPL